MTAPSSLERLIDALRCLPGVGQKSAQRMAYHLLQRDRTGAQRLSDELDVALQCIRHCRRCNNFTEDEICDRCLSPRRDATLLCIVEMPVDLGMMEQTHAYNGLYYVLMGRLNPIEGIGPKELHLERLFERASDPAIKEVIMATNFTHEGEATAHYLSEALHARDIKVSRIARGIPVGGELEFSDASTIAQAMVERRDY